MAVTWGERPGSLETSNNPESATLHFVLTGTSTESTARTLAEGYSAAMYNALYRTNIAIKEVGAMLWDVAVTYGSKKKKEPEAGDSSWAFDTTGGTKRITQTLEHINDYQPGGKGAIDNKGAIGVNENGDVEGVDVIDHSFKWRENHTLLLASFGWTYSDLLETLTGTVNNAAFRGKPAGTVLFEGATGGQSAKDPLLLDVTYNFRYSAAGVALVAGDIAGIAKDGHEYLWIQYDTTDDATGKKLAKQPRQANVEKVYETEDFSLLGIGTAAPS